MTLANFIKAHRKEIDDYIHNAIPNYCKVDDEEKELWILNDEGLYNLAISEGVDI